MIQYIETGAGEERRLRPVCFDNSLSYEFERMTGKSFIMELNLLFDELRAVGKSLGTDDVATASGNVSMVRYVDIIYHAFRVGAIKARDKVDFIELDVAEWLDDRATATTLTTWLAEANMAPKGEPDDAKKKQTTTERPRRPMK